MKTKLFLAAPCGLVPPITPGWNDTLRLYRPHKDILDGIWKIPEAQVIP